MPPSSSSRPFSPPPQTSAPRCGHVRVSPDGLRYTCIAPPHAKSEPDNHYVVRVTTPGDPPDPTNPSQPPLPGLKSREIGGERRA